MSVAINQLDRLDLVSGALRYNDQAIGYWPIEISGLLFTVATDRQLPEGEHLVFVDGESIQINLQVKRSEAYQGYPGYFISQLSSLNPEINIEKVVRDMPELARFSFYYPQAEDHFSGRFPVRAARFVTKDNIEVLARTFGTRGDFSLKTEDVSKSGLLIREDDGQRAPFALNTIVEIIIDPSGNQLGKPVQCLGKIVRREGGGQKEMQKYGVRLIDMDDVAQTQWVTYVEKLERRLADLR